MCFAGAAKDELVSKAAARYTISLFIVILNLVEASEGLP
jgi:hypothetical protein